jgi:hypothetical protein
MSDVGPALMRKENDNAIVSLEIRASHRDPTGKLKGNLQVLTRSSHPLCALEIDHLLAAFAHPHNV